MGDAAKKRATYDDLIDTPEGVLAEVLDGVLYTHPRPGGPHTLATSVLGGDLLTAFQLGRGGPGGWFILDEPELHLRGDALVPDLAGWRRDRMPRVPEGASFDMAPDWICEVLSPGNTVHDRERKLPIYAREKVGHAWLVDPRERTLESFRLESGRWSLLATFSGDALVRAEPFEAFELELGALWR